MLPLVTGLLVLTPRRGGSPEARARLLLEVVRGIRKQAPPGFIVGVKLNSADHQRGGFAEEVRCLQHD
jgi:2,4-dienoyl-CoA reductase-like NADH-dependent reductase (Old Yellow Enzyme family)